MRKLWLVVFLCACGPSEGPAKPDGGGPAAETPPTDRDAWWKQATTTGSGAEKILAPRELRGLLADGRRYGFATDEKWWKERTDFVYDRVLDLDPDDVEANAGKGYKTLQSHPGFKALWKRMIEARVPSEEIDHLLQVYDNKVQNEQPIFLRAEAWAVEKARLERAKDHLDRLENDAQYGALQVALARVRGSSLNDYPYVHKAVGPFLVFYCARDLQMIEGEDEAAEKRRVDARREVYQRKLDKLASVYEGLIRDLRELYPTVWKTHAPKKGEIFYQWIFGAPDWYREFAERLGKSNPESTYRSGFLDGSSGWAYFFEPEERAEQPNAPPGNQGAAPPPRAEPKPTPPETVLRETAAYLAVRQLMHRWGKDRKALRNRLDRSRAYWLKEGWPAFLAARQVKKPDTGSRIAVAHAAKFVLPPLSRVVERESRLELRNYREPRHEFHDDEEERPQLMVRDGFVDLAWLLARHLSRPKTRATFERYLLDQVAGKNTGFKDFEKAFGISGEKDWARLQRAVYATIGK